MAKSVIVTGEVFLTLLQLEQRRVERSCGHFILVLIESAFFQERSAHLSQRLVLALCDATRATDIKGWYEEKSTFGIIFTEVSSDRNGFTSRLLTSKISVALSSILTAEQLAQVHVSSFVLPDDWDKHDFQPAWRKFNLQRQDSSKRLARIAKRCIDIVGSLSAIVVLAPVFLAIATAIKLTSRGPVVFCQKRNGQNGRLFKFFKFRSMYVNNDQSVHENYVKRLISGDPGLKQASGSRQPVYKMTDDPRVTPVGRFIRRMSLDELPQFFNVLLGDMSLVGPRPPLPYEVANYAPWHQRRLREVKPGITGLWQVYGRSRTTFDEMVRMDLQYGRMWSIVLDLKLLLQTPWAMLRGTGAY